MAPFARSRRLPRLSRLYLAALGLAAVMPAKAADIAPRDVVLLDRLTWGVTASSVAHFESLGAERWFQEQLHPPTGEDLPDAARTQIEALTDMHRPLVEIASAFDTQGRTANQIPDAELKKA